MQSMLLAEAVCQKEVYCVLQQLEHCTAGVYSYVSPKTENRAESKRGALWRRDSDLCQLLAE